MKKTIIILLNFAFKCSLVNETCTIALEQADTQANQLASVLNHTGNITNFTKITHIFFNFCVCHIKGVSGKHPICDNNTYHIV